MATPPGPTSDFSARRAAAMPAVTAALRAAGCVFAEDEAHLLVAQARSEGDLARLVAERCAGVPLEHVLGWAQFCGLRVAVTPGVFVPRRRTELLVREAARVARRGDVVVDLCCGSGAVGMALAHAVAGILLHLGDIDAAAVTCARTNAGPTGQVHRGDLYDALPATLRGAVAVLAVNAPYVPTDAIALMPLEARTHEPRIALDGGPDGLDAQRRVVASARQWLAPGGRLLIETSAHQAELTRSLMTAAGLSSRVVRSAVLDATVVVGRVGRVGRAGRATGDARRGAQAVAVSGGSSRSRDPRDAV